MPESAQHEQAANQATPQMPQLEESEQPAAKPTPQ
eukprot:CAMPEP_0172623384 /NCGR_PEP_ID=MMETSP1068-20121228/128169_1 /TAXON_ID=35684 /ORGANISM="Pseudopedinella elastica, Strain CCMP716" /LENGTH=34 /DNA_ID= /DNA_START= /DNA_END= /DNA_ORIENTATION=